ncbi:hypothetical protein [Cupriavidus pauculus]|uniref:hypothetical protein n=1 Tax=Cupriavidus pauculus TaxID=82633 RepID=UPI001FCF8EB0|nr:hypothetical protein [Cupriavidus pauculus]
MTFVIYDATEQDILNVEGINVPLALDTPERLKFVRNTVLDIIRQYDVRRAGIRITESNAQRISVERIELEGVLQEAFASSEIERYFCGQISSISARLGINRAKFKPYVEGDEMYPDVDKWDEQTKEEREAILTAIGAANY